MKILFSTLVLHLSIVFALPSERDIFAPVGNKSTCSTNKDCSMVVKHSRCISGKCSCGPAMILTVAIDGTESCKFGLPSGTIGTCAANTGLNLVKLGTMATCTVGYAQYGDDCTLDGGCKEMRGVCTKQKCLCRRRETYIEQPWGRYPYTFPGGMCVPDYSNFDKSCKTDANCMQFNGQCSAGKCICPGNMNFVYNVILSKMLCMTAPVGYESPCSTDKNCSMVVKHSRCDGGKCSCGPAMIHTVDRDGTEFCKFGLPSGTLGTCPTNTGLNLVRLGTKVICTLGYAQNGDDCTGDFGCYKMLGGCINNKCQCGPDETYKKERWGLYPYTFPGGKCVPDVKTFRCTCDRDCSGKIRGAICRKNKCICRNGAKYTDDDQGKPACQSVRR